jgi:siroheme synthase
VAVISHATLPTQREVISDLEHAAEAVESAALPAPALVIVGDVVALRTHPASLAGLASAGVTPWAKLAP